MRELKCDCLGKSIRALRTGGDSLVVPPKAGKRFRETSSL